jgi:hypothetical protein
MGSNILGKQVSLEKIVADPRVRSDPTANKVDTGSLISVANDTSPRASVRRQTLRGLFKISYLYRL